MPGRNGPAPGNSGAKGNSVSAEVGVIFVLPVVAVAGAVGLAAGAVGLAAGALGDHLSERQSRGWAAADRLRSAVAAHDLLEARVARERERFGDLITALPTLPRPPSAGADVARAEALGAQIDALVAAAEQRFRAEAAAARAGRIMADVAAAIARLPKPPPTPGRPAVARTEPTTLIAESLERVLRRMDTGVPPDVATVLQGRAADALRVDSEATALRLLDDLRYSVDQANERVRRRAGALAELAKRMSGYAGPAIEAAQALIVAAHDDPDPDLPAIGRQVDAAIEETLAPLVRDYTRRALRESLEEIGCTVEEEFEVALGRDGMAHVRGPGWDDLAVRIRSRDGEAYHFNLVAPRDGEVPDLQAVESQWCGAVDRLLPALGERGLEVHTTHRSEEGDPEVQYVDPARFPFEQRRQQRRRQDTARRRELPR